MVMRGDTVTLTGAFYSAPGGPLVPVTNISLRIYHGSTQVAGPFTTGFVTITPGMVTYDWVVPADAEIGTYVAQWSALYPDADNPSVGVEEFSVRPYSALAPYAGCPWPVDPGCLSSEWAGFTAEVKDQAVALASSTLQRLTAYRVGNCPVTVRPTNHRGAACFVPYTVGDLAAFHPGVDITGRWINGCGCSETTCTITLPGPVGRVDAVKVDGVVLSPSTYIVDGNAILWRGPGECPWPLWQDVTVPDTEVGTLSVTYLNAAPVDALGARAVGLLSMEYAKACTGGKCELPKGVTSIVRQGVAMEINPGMFPDGFTGIREVDAFISLWNPRGSKQTRRSTVYSPDTMGARVH